MCTGFSHCFGSLKVLVLRFSFAMALSLALQTITSSCTLQSLLFGSLLSFSQFSACHNGLDLLAKMAKKHQHSLHGVELLHSDCEPEPVCLSLVL